jgi:folate-binding protein YgfZ
VSLEDEVRAIREKAVYLPRPDVATLRLSGADRVRYLNGQVSNDVAALAIGQGQRAVKPSPKGRVEAVLRVRALPESFELDLDRSVAAKIKDGLERFIIMDDCAIEDVSAGREVVGVYGPRAAEILGEIGLSAAEGLPNLAFEKVGATVVVRDGGLGVDGFELQVAPGASAQLQARLQNAGVLLASEEALEVVRVEAGVAKDGVDLDEEIIPLEAGLDEAISHTKGCYVGQEVIARATNLGGVRHRLVKLEIEGARPPVDAELWPSGADKATGELTSVVWSPLAKKVIALGYVRIIHEAPGTKLAVRWADGEASATIQPR